MQVGGVFVGGLTLLLRSKYSRALSVLFICLFVFTAACNGGGEEAASDNSSDVTLTETPIPFSVPVVSMNESGTVIKAICRMSSGGMTLETCREQFISDKGYLGLGEPVMIISNRSGSLESFRLSMDFAETHFPITDLDLTIAQLSPGPTYYVSLNYEGTGWSEPFPFLVDELIPLAPQVEKLCAGQECAPMTVLTTPKLVGKDYLFPFVEFISGVAYTDEDFGWFDQNYLWAELMLDDNDDALGCLNCALAALKGYVYEARIPFGDTGIFYNWDLKNLTPGSHSLKARLRNSKHTGPWSAPFTFQVAP